MALILVAEDDGDLRQLLSDMLESRGHHVATAADGVKMIEQARDLRPSLIVADLMMPGAYGSAAAKALQQDPATASIPIIFLTAVAPAQAEKVVPKAPHVRLMHKPMDMPALFAAVAELLAPSA